MVLSTGVPGAGHDPLPCDDSTSVRFSCFIAFPGEMNQKYSLILIFMLFTCHREIVPKVGFILIVTGMVDPW